MEHRSREHSSRGHIDKARGFPGAHPTATDLWWDVPSAAWLLLLKGKP